MFIRQFIWILLLGISFSLPGQKILVEGQVVDMETYTPLPYATLQIFNQGTGTIADKEGKFSILIENEQHLSDSIEFSYLGYSKLTIPISSILNEQGTVIALEVSSYELSEVSVFPQSYRIKRLGIKKKKPEREQYANVFNANKGNYIGNTMGVAGRIKAVSFYMADVGFPHAPFRIRVYEMDMINRSPGKDLLNENVVVSASGPGWFTVDMSKYNIPFPLDGAFVMMEWINSGKEFYFIKELKTTNQNGEVFTKKRQFYGQTLGSVLRQPGMITWGRGLGQPWIPYEINYRGYLNVMINADVAFPVD